MTHTGPMSESDGVLSEPTVAARKCPRCNESMQHQTWDSSDGAYEDSKYSCPNPKCGFVQWVDGIDS